jgi:hypothetical protein
MMCLIDTLFDDVPPLLRPAGQSFSARKPRGRAHNSNKLEHAMKLATFTALAVLLSAGYAFAGAGAPVPEGSQSGEPSGRPSAVLDDAHDRELRLVIGAKLLNA